MRIVRFRTGAKTRYGVLEGAHVREYSGTPFGTFTRARDTFAPVGPCIATSIDPNTVEIETWVNGERRQASSTKMFIFPVKDVVARVSQVMTLLPGDVIATGTPCGIGSIQPGDRVEVRIEGIGTLKNSVVRLP